MERSGGPLVIGISSLRDFSGLSSAVAAAAFRFSFGQMFQALEIFERAPKKTIYIYTTSFFIGMRYNEPFRLYMVMTKSARIDFFIVRGGFCYESDGKPLHSKHFPQPFRYRR